MTLRATLLGLFAAVVIGLMLPVTEFLTQGTRLGVGSATPAAFFLLFVIVIGPQLLVKCWRPDWALKSGELLVIFSMMAVATVIPTRGFGGMFYSAITAPTYYANESNGWADRIVPHLPSWMVVGDRNAVRQMYEGLDEGASFPWRAWATPLAWWTGFMLCLSVLVISTVLLLRKTWMDHERLAFPIAQVALSLTEEPEPQSRLNPLFRSTLFWVGFVVPLTVGSLQALSRYFPGTVPTPQLSWTLQEQTAYLPRIVLHLSFVTLGFVFFVESKLSFSLWFFYLLTIPAYCVYSVYFPGHAEPRSGPLGGAYPTIMGHQQLGAMLVLAATMFYTARKQVLREKALLSVFAISGAAVAAMVCLMGLAWWAAPLLIGVALVIWLALTRVTVQAGFPSMVPAVYPLPILICAFGTDALGGAALVAVLGFAVFWCAEFLTFMMAPAANGVYVQGKIGVDPARGLLSLTGAILLGLCASMFMTLALCYEFGGLNLHPQYFNRFPMGAWNSALSTVSHPTGPSLHGYAWTAVGAGAMVLLTVLHRLFFWWPFHPLGFLAQGGWNMGAMWFSFFLAWVVKTAVLRLGGGRAYKSTRHFFIGMIVGVLVTGGLWLLIDSMTGMKGNGLPVY